MTSFSLLAGRTGPICSQSSDANSLVIWIYHVGEISVDPDQLASDDEATIFMNFSNVKVFITYVSG